MFDATDLAAGPIARVRCPNAFRAAPTLLGAGLTERRLGYRLAANWPVAQWSEQGTHNPSVEGSIPSGPTVVALVAALSALHTKRPPSRHRLAGCAESATCDVV